jgi:CIC family chloride channel protein
MFHRLRLPVWLKPALGGLLVGGFALVVPGALHMGYGWVQIGMGRGLLDLPLWMVVALPFAKIVSTSLSIGSGGSGGIFGPGMVIGGMLGATFWRLTYGLLPGLPDSPAPFVIVGMMALFGGIAHAPLAVMLMVAEMTGNLSMLAPAMVAVGVSTALVGDTTIYRSQLRNRASAPAHRVQFSFPLLSALLVRDAMSQARATIGVDASVEEACNQLGDQGAASLAVVDTRNRFVGIVTRDGLHARTERAQDGASARVGTLLSTSLEPLSPSDSLDVALEQLADSALPWLPVVADARVVGGLSARDALRTYKATLGRSVRRAQGLPEQTSLFEVRLGVDSPLAHRRLRDAGLPKQTLVLAVVRETETLFPSADTQLLPGDVLQVLASEASEQHLKAFLGPAATADSRSG